MPTDYNYDIRLRGRRRCKNCWWWETGLCYADASEFHVLKTDADSWCPDWSSRRIENKEGSFLRYTQQYKLVIVGRKKGTLEEHDESDIY